MSGWVEGVAGWIRDGVDEARAADAERALGQRSARAQVATLRRLGRRCLTRYGLDHAPMTLLHHGENTTFRVEAEGRRWMLRVHREGYQAPPMIASELAWLEALADAGTVTAPVPVADRQGRLMCRVQDPVSGVARCCVLFGWVEGRFSFKRRWDGPWEALGEALGALHAFARTWQRPPGFTRRPWDAHGLMGEDGGLWGRPEAALGPERSALAALVGRTREAAWRQLEDLAGCADAARGVQGPHMGLIHADMHSGNVLFADGKARPIDFDDCGDGFWVYDLVIALGAWRWRPELDARLAAVSRGYARRAPWSSLDLRLFDPLLAARAICGLGWILGRAATNPRLRPFIDRACERAERDMRGFLSEA